MRGRGTSIVTACCQVVVARSRSVAVSWSSRWLLRQRQPADGSPVLRDRCRSYVTNGLSVLKPLVEVAGECALRWIDNSSPPPAFFVHCGLGVHFLVEATPLDLLSPTVRRWNIKAETPPLTVLRGVFGNRSSTHASGSQKTLISPVFHCFFACSAASITLFKSSSTRSSSTPLAEKASVSASTVASRCTSSGYRLASRTSS